MSEIYDVAIIGSGPAGLTAGIYNTRAKLKTVIVSGNSPGGQLTMTTQVENFPGFPEGISGPKLMMDMQEQFKRLGGEIKNGVVVKISKIQNPSKSPFDKGDFKIELGDGIILESKVIIVATGAGTRWLNLARENELVGRGISGCATCDAMFYKEKIVAVIGGGDTACVDAVLLAKFANKVYMVHRRSELRADKNNQEKVLNNPKIEMVWDSEVVEIIGEQKLTAIKIKNNKTNEKKILEIDGMFVAVGYEPATSFVKDLVETTESGHIVVGKNSEYLMMTSIEGILAAGDCTNERYRQAIVAAGAGARAAMDAERWLENKLS